MTDGHTERTDDAGLEGLFAAARDDAPVPSGDFMARLTEQALAEMPMAGAHLPEPRPGLWAQLWPALGGWRGLSGLVTACAVGVWLGVSPPAAMTTGLGLDDLWGRNADLGEMGVDPLSGFELALLEG